MSDLVPERDSATIALRAYACRSSTKIPLPESTHKKPYKKRGSKPSDWVLVFDTETSTDAAQKLKFGTYQVRKADDLIEAGLFYDPEAINSKELNILIGYAQKNELKILRAEEFVEEIFYGVGYAYRATIVGFNLPFDISRLALEHTTARQSRFNKIMHGGFTFKLSDNSFNPRVQIKHISSRNSFIQFAATKGQRTSRGNRKKGRFNSVRRGFFIDVKTLAAALTSQSHSLASLAVFLNVEAQKHETEDHGKSITENYVAYAVQDTQTTWECFLKLRELYKDHNLSLTEPHNIHSEASLGKAYLKEMGIQPWRKVQPDFPPEMIGQIMSTYYGGRSEVHIRREITQILYCDFLSMYPTVCTLMGLWSFVTSQGMTWEDTTEKTKELIDYIKLDDLQSPNIWKDLCTLVQVMPDADIFPVRSKYAEDSQYTIGLNYLTSETPLWFTLADCLSSKLLTGKSPRVIKATTFSPLEIQTVLRTVDIAGNPEYQVDPTSGDFFKRIIDLRSSVKNSIKTANSFERQALESRQISLKLLANSTSYGIFVEVNVEEEKTLQSALCYGASGKENAISIKKIEATGAFFHPLLATLITGAARLMLSITESMAVRAGIDWAFCDTDSMALAKPASMDTMEFYSRAKSVQEWFTPLNPYENKAPLLKVEEYNFSCSAPKDLHPLYCYAISSKRYALFNFDTDKSLSLRKISAHGLGHLIAPYAKEGVSYLEDVAPWQQDLWEEIIQADIEKRHPDYSKFPNFDSPSISRYGATTPQLLKWFEAYNADRPYKEAVRPFNFLLSMQARPEYKGIRPASPYERDPSKAVRHCFDRETGKKVQKCQLKTNNESLAQYHLHPETKFLNGNFLDKGITKRRHIFVTAINYIGKEANKWEEQFYTGLNDEAQIEYGLCSSKKNEMLNYILKGIEEYCSNELAAIAALSPRYILNVANGNSSPSISSLFKLYQGVKYLDAKREKEQKILNEISEAIIERNMSVRALAQELKIDPSNLSKLLGGKRKNTEHLKYIHAYLMG